MMILSIRNVSKSFGSTKALNGVSFDMDEGEIVALLGPSGCGKSTLLSIIAGLELADQGDIFWNNHSLHNTPPHRRGFGLMFQDYALFPHMNVYANVAFGLKMANLQPEAISNRVAEMLELVGLPGFSKRDVNTLSGGEQQRIALARALAPGPQLLMLDEPLGSLDRNLRERLVIDLRAILHQMMQTAIYVTHDQEEAFSIADRIVLINSGHIEQIGFPQEIFGNPETIFVARFLEMSNIIPGIVRQKDGSQMVYTAVGNFPIVSPVNGDVDLLIRPDLAQVNGIGENCLNGLVKEVTFRGSMQKVVIVVNHTPLTFEFPSQTILPKKGEEISILVNPNRALKAFPK